MVGREPEWFNCIPPENITQKMCDDAVRTDCKMVLRVPSKFIMQEIFWNVLHEKSSLLVNLLEVPALYDMYDAALKKSPSSWLNIDETVKTKEFCEEMVKRQSKLIRYVPQGYCTAEMWEKSVNEHPSLFLSIPYRFVTEKMSEDAVDKEPEMIQYVPDRMKTSKMCENAVAKKPKLLYHVPDELKTSKMCENAIEKSPELLYNVPIDLRTSKMCEYAVVRKPSMLLYVPIKLRTPEMYTICKNDTNGLNNLIGVTMTGKQFNELFNDIVFYKLTSKSEIHNDFKFVTGLNTDTVPFTTYCTCCPGGIYFTAKNNLHQWITYKSEPMVYKRLITIPDDANVHFEKDKLKADKLILGPKQPIIPFYSYLTKKILSCLSN